MKLLNLILYSENTPEYFEMKIILETYLNKLNNFKYYFYCYKESLEKEYEIQDNIIYIKGKETFIPGILEKTIKVFDICRNLKLEYDFIVRSNISTIINFPALQQFLYINVYNKYDYIGNTLTTRNTINSKQYFHNFAFGMCIVLSKKLINYILEHKNTIDYSFIDDNSLGIFCKDHNIPLYNIEHIIENTDKFYYSKLIYRNKSENRDDDIKRMKMISKVLEDNLNIQNMLEL